MLRVAAKSAKKQQNSSNSPKDGMDQASADEQKGSQGQKPEDIEFSPAPGVVKGGNSVRYTPVVPSEREQAALSALAHAQRVSQGQASPLLPFNFRQASGGTTVPHTASSKTQTTPSISQVDKLRASVSAAISKTSLMTGSMDRPADMELSASEIFDLQKSMVYGADGPLQADAILSVKLLGEIRVLKEQFAQQQTHLQQQALQNQALTEFVQSLGSRSQPIPVPSESPAPGTPFSSWLQNSLVAASATLQGQPNNQVQPPAAPPQLNQAPSSSPRTAQDKTDKALMAFASALAQPSVQQSVDRQATGPAQVPKPHSQTRANPKVDEQQEYEASQRLFAQNAQDEKIIRQAQKRIAQRQSHSQEAEPQVPPAKTKSSRKPTHEDEMRNAALTGDKELLKHGSTKLRSTEVLSDDDQEEVLKEVKPTLAAHNLFNPRNPRPVRNKAGYVKAPYIASSDEDDDPQSDGDVDDDQPDDVDDPDWEPTDTPTPSPSRRTISTAEFKELQEFRRAKKAATGGALAPVDKALPPRITVTVAEPPKHGVWNDVHHLMEVFKDEHTTYKHRCGEGTSLSVWECYTQTAKDSILTFLKSTPKGKLLNRTAAYMAALSDDAIYFLLQNEMGLTHSTEVERALFAIKFPAGILDAANWVTFHTSWLQVLHRVSSDVEILPRRMAEIFRESVPDAYIKKWLTARKHHSWEEAYSAVIDALSDPVLLHK
jgi:hypothetical protein